MSLLDRVLQKIKREGLIRTTIAVFKSPLTLVRRIQYQNMLRRSSIGERFNEIYQKQLWGSKESGSGRGSEINFTQPLRQWLVEKIPQLEVEVFVDAPCGDFNWMRHVIPSLNIKYIGLDIVASVIKSNRDKYSSDVVKFDVANICEDDLPGCDLIMVRDFLYHLSFDDTNKFLINLERTTYRYLLTSTHIVDSNFSNSDIITGDFRLIDLFSSPFCFDENHLLDRVSDYPNGYQRPREMILIEKKFVPRSISPMCK